MSIVLTVWGFIPVFSSGTSSKSNTLGVQALWAGTSPLLLVLTCDLLDFNEATWTPLWCALEEGGIPSSLWGRDGGWTPVTPSPPTPRLSQASQALLMFYLPGSLVHTLLRKYNSLSIINLYKVHCGFTMEPACITCARSMRNLSDCFTGDVDNVAAPEY